MELLEPHPLDDTPEATPGVNVEVTLARIEAHIAPYLAWHHPLKGAIFARDWIAEARETQDPAWRDECLLEARLAFQFLMEAR